MDHISRPSIAHVQSKKTLTHPKFLRLYQQIMQKDGLIHLKTDSPDLYQFTKTVINLFDLELLQDTADVYAAPEISQELSIKTYYESLDIAKSNRIHYLQFRINKDLPFGKDEILKQLISEHTID